MISRPRRAWLSGRKRTEKGQEEVPRVEEDGFRTAPMTYRVVMYKSWSYIENALCTSKSKNNLLKPAPPPCLSWP